MSHAVQNSTLLLGAAFSATAAALHVGIVIKGAPWYRFFGAGERFTLAAEKGHGWHNVATLAIAFLLATFAAYALSGGGYLRALPQLKWVLCAITAVYLARGVLGFLLILWPKRSHSMRFLVVSSAVCFGMGAVHLLGLVQVWKMWNFSIFQAF